MINLTIKQGGNKMNTDAKATKEKELKALLKVLKDAGTKRGDIARVLFAKGGFTEAQVGTAMGINPKSAAAMKVDFSKKGKKEWTAGHRVHVNFAEAKLKGPGGAQLYTKLIGLARAVTA
jgi:hypothetical protein